MAPVPDTDTDAEPMPTAEMDRRSQSYTTPLEDKPEKMLAATKTLTGYLTAWGVLSIIIGVLVLLGSVVNFAGENTAEASSTTAVD
jgi:uncharacterized membrane protein YkgB